MMTLQNARCRERRGAIFITAMAVTVMLAGLALVFTQSMRTEVLASANRSAAAQAEAVEQGAEQWVLAQVEANVPDALTITEIPAEAIQVGDGYFWILRPNPDLDTQWAYGISDETSKLNLNTATTDQMLSLPGMTQDAAACIRDWVDADETPTAGGVESSYYGMLAHAYQTANAPFTSIEELLLIKDVTPELLFGYDRNHDGVLSEAERSGSNSGTSFNSAGDTGRGLFNYVTLYGTEPNTTETGDNRLNVNTRSIGQLRNGLRIVLRNGLAGRVNADARIDAIVTNVINIATAAQRANATQYFPNLGAFYVASGMTSEEYALIADNVTSVATPTISGMMNVNTASRQALMTLPGLESSDADAIIAARGSADTTGYSWAFNALTPQKVALMGGSITAKSYFYSADIVAVSGNGRAYKRVRIVVDAQATPKIVYRKDLTSLGWPLDRAVRDSLRAGQGLATKNSLATGGR